MDNNTSKVYSNTVWTEVPIKLVQFTLWNMSIFSSRFDIPVALGPIFLLASVAYIDSTAVSLQCCNVEERRMQMKIGTVNQLLHRKNTIEMRLLFQLDTLQACISCRCFMVLWSQTIVIQGPSLVPRAYGYKLPYCHTIETHLSLQNFHRLATDHVFLDLCWT